MKLYWISSRGGDWLEPYAEPGNAIRVSQECPRCFRVTWKLVPPLTLAFESLGEHGDFLIGTSRLAAKHSVATELMARFTGFTLSPVEVLPKYIGKKAAKAIEAEYVELFSDTELTPNPELTTGSWELLCSACGRRQFNLIGGERITDYCDPESKDVLERRVRDPEVGFSFDGADSRLGLFRIPADYNLNITFCTESFKDYTLTNTLSNIDFFECGEIA